MNSIPKIELIIPPNPYLGDDRRNPPLGLLYLAAVAEKDRYNLKINDLRGMPIDSIKENIGDADIYGITASTPDYLLAEEIAEVIKSKHKSAWTVLGGMHATSVSKDIGSNFDKVVIGEGELAFMNLLNDYKKGDNNKRFYNEAYIEDLDSIPFPARHLLPIDAAFSKNAFSSGDQEYAGTLITSRGCPNSCSFCASETMWGRKVRFQTPENVENEIKQIIKDYGVHNFRFQDDTMVLKRKRLEELCSRIKPLGIRWRATTRVDHSDKEMLELMADSGCEELGYGIESLSQAVLDKNAKGIKLEDIPRALRNTREAGLKSRLFFIIGLPGEEKGYSQRLEEFLEKESPDGVDISTMVLYPGTDLFNNPEKYGLKIENQDYGAYHMTLGLIPGEIDRNPTFSHDILSTSDIIDERKKSLEIIKKRKAIKNF